MRLLLVTALESFASDGFHGTSTREIAKRANMSSTAIYAHYKSKEELLYTIALTMASDGLRQLQEAAALKGSSRERLQRVIRAHVKYHAVMATAARVTNYEIHALTPEHRSAVNGIYDKTKQIVRKCLKDGVRSGEFIIDSLPTTVVAIMSLGISVCRWYSSDGRTTPDELADHYAKLVLRMVHADTSLP